MGGYGAPGLPQYLYYRPPPATPYFPFSQLPDSSSSSSQSTPTWFIVAAAVAAVIFCCLLYIFLRKWERKAEHCHDKEVTATTGPVVIPWGGCEARWLEDCPACRHKGGLYHFKYKCAGCRYKNECGIHVQFPSSTPSSSSSSSENLM